MKWLRLLTTLALTLAALPGRAAIAVDQTPELVLFLWDPVAKASYSRDLGLSGYSGTDTALRQQSFWVQAQQDAGLQRFWTLDPTADANYAKFRSVATNVSSIVWAIVGVDATADVLRPGDNPDPFAPGETSLLTTMRPTTTPGVAGAAYGAMARLANGDFVVNAQSYSLDLGNQLNIDALNTANNTHLGGSTAANGSSFDVEGGQSYFGKSAGVFSRFGSSCNCDLTTPVGSSSWFYKVTTSDPFDQTVSVSIDEFDNLRNDGYWGVAQNASGQLVLSYTLAPATLSTLAVTAEGRARAALTEFAAGSVIRTVAAPVGEFAGYLSPAGFDTLAPVPEPAPLALLAAGGMLLGWRLRRGR